MSFAGSNGSRSRSASRSPYHERAKASSSSSRSPGPPPPPPKSQSFFINVQPRGMRPETAAAAAVPRNLLYSNQSPARSPSKAKLDVKEPSTPTKNFEVHQENVCFVAHHDHNTKDYCEALPPSRKARVATPIKTPKPCTGAAVAAAATSSAFSPSRPYCGSPKYQKVLVERPALYYNNAQQAGGTPNSAAKTTEAAVGLRKTTRVQPGKIEVTISQLQNRIKKFMQQDENLLPLPKSSPAAEKVSWNSTTKVSIRSGDDNDDDEKSSSNVQHHPQKTFLSPLPHSLKVHKGGIAFTAGVEEQPPPAAQQQKLLSPRPDVPLGKQRPRRRCLDQNPDFFTIGDASGRSSVSETIGLLKADSMLISKLSRAADATRVDNSNSETAAEMVLPFLNQDALAAATMSCNNIAEMEVKEPTTTLGSGCLSQCTARGNSTSMTAEKIPPLDQGSLVEQLNTSNAVHSSSEIAENAPLVVHQDGLVAKMSSNNVVVNSNKVKEEVSSVHSTQKACTITEVLACGEGEAVVTQAATVQTMGSNCPVELLGIEEEEEDEIDVHEHSSRARFLMGMVFGILLAGLGFSVLLASGSQGHLLPQKWHVNNPLESSWQKSSIRKSVSEMSKSIKGLWEDCSSTTTQHPIVDLILLCEGYGHAKTQVYLLVRRIQCEHFKDFAAAYVGGYPSLSLSVTTGDRQNLDETTSSGGFWNHHLTSILHHFRTVGLQLAMKVSQMASNITLDSVMSWVLWKPKLEVTSTDIMSNAGGESRELGVKYSVASLVMVGETSSNLREPAAPLDMPSNVVANNEDDTSLLHALLEAEEAHSQVTIDASVPPTRSVVSKEDNCKATVSVDMAGHLKTEFSTLTGGIQTDLSPKAREIMCSDASSSEQIDSLGLTSFVGEDITTIRDDHVDGILIQELFEEEIDGADTATSQVLHHESAAEGSLVQEVPSYIIVAMGSFVVTTAAVAISLALKWQRTSAHGKEEMKMSVKEGKASSPAASMAELPPPIPTVTWTTMAPVYDNLPTDKPNTGAISSPAYKVMAPGKFGLQEFSTVYNRDARPALSTPTRLDRPASLMLEKPTVSAPTGFNTKLGYISERPTVRTPLRTYTPTAPYMPSESSMSSTGSASGSGNGSEISSSNQGGTGSDTNSVIESQLSMMPDGSQQLGSFTAYEPVAITEGPGVEQIKITPVRRSSRIRSQVSSPAHFA
ncbi:unnamed protein product [Sphagnum troendelagicum]|uniref:Uncharacterized protein n=1 Tax=Sphagnum troendelagicum TaxID=128251 RepID=A0ABP0TPU5_9BRYO